ncbi:MAG: rhodanese-like domain-containing protein [Spirochaetaceae bacterium]|nr:MAG: rhodanese-like domain-containing protein [Spirochaetaceae bacterium]
MEPGTPRGFDPATTVVVDVRSPEEYREGHLPGAVNLPVGEIMNRYGEIPTDGRRVIVYCAGGSRSEYARMVLAQLGVAGIENGGGLTQIMMKLKVM